MTNCISNTSRYPAIPYNTVKSLLSIFFLVSEVSLVSQCPLAAGSGVPGPPCNLPPTHPLWRTRDPWSAAQPALIIRNGLIIACQRLTSDGGGVHQNKHTLRLELGFQSFQGYEIAFHEKRQWKRVWFLISWVLTPPAAEITTSQHADNHSLMNINHRVTSPGFLGQCQNSDEKAW